MKKEKRFDWSALGEAFLEVIVVLCLFGIGVLVVSVFGVKWDVSTASEWLILLGAVVLLVVSGVVYLVTHRMARKRRPAAEDGGDFTAHYSQKQPWIFMGLACASLVGVLLALGGSSDVPISAIVAFAVCVVTFLVAFFVNVRKCGVAVEVTGEKLILHKSTVLEIPLADIQRVNIRDGDGSLDMSVKTADAKYSMHCFISDERVKREQLMSILKDKGIRVETYDL